MPYRRLPNTDSARYRAIKKVVELGRTVSPVKLAVTQASLHKAKCFFPQFEQALSVQKTAQSNQVKRSKEHVELQKRARLYVSHFIQVLNFAIARGELAPSVREYYNLPLNDNKVPNLNTDQELIEWGDKIIKGEAARINKGGNMMYNPTIALVRVRYEKYLESYNRQKSLQDINSNALNKIAGLRAEADEIILKIWNEIEAYFIEFPEAEKRKLCEEYGLVYFFRRAEKKKMLLDLQNTKQIETNFVSENDIIETNELSENRFNVINKYISKEEHRTVENILNEVNEIENMLANIN